MVWRRLVVGGLIIAVLAWAFTHAKRPVAPVAGRGGARPAPVARDTTRAASIVVRLYFASPGGDSLAGEMREVATRPGLHERVESLVKELVRGPRQGGVPLLPQGTAVRHVYLDPRGLMTLDLTPAFHDRFRGGSTAELLTVASIVRTLLENVPEARSVRLVCGGGPLATLAGHIDCLRPFDGRELP